MSQSPEEGAISDGYNNGWQTINELIREGGSWSGRERNNFYLNLGDGSFAEVSGALGLNQIEDGRAFSSWDYDGDGDLDILLKNRNGPQLRLLRNDLENRNHSLVVRLVGTTDNRDAVGAQVRVRAAAQWRTRWVQSGAGFLSQSSSRLYFGLGSSDMVQELIVRWPDGTEQHFSRLAADQLIEIRQGESEIRSKPFAESTASLAGEALPGATSTRGHSWMALPAPAPGFDLVDLDGNLARLSDSKGRYQLVNFWATWCGPCRGELKSWAQRYATLEKAGVRLLAISVDDAGDRGRVDEFRRELGLPFPIVHADQRLIRRFNVFYRSLFVRKSDMQIPTTFLIGPDGAVLKIYRGAAEIETVLADVHQVAGSSFQGGEKLPFKGRSVSFQPFRDEFPLGTRYLEEGLFSDATAVLRRVVEADPDAAEAWNNLGASYLEQQLLVQAQDAFSKAVSTRADYLEAWLNLGAALRNLGRTVEARHALTRASKLAPDLASAQIQLALLEAETGHVDEAIRLSRQYLDRRPKDADAHNSLGIFYAQQGQLSKAIEAFLKATVLDPGLGQAHVNLGRAYLQTDQAAKAVAALEKGAALESDQPPVHYFLAQAYVAAGQRDEALQSLERVLELDPASGAARQLRKQLSPVPPEQQP